MSDDSRGLKFDRRLMRRRGWTDPEELRRYLDSLPDVSDKIQPPEEREERPRGSAPEGEPGAGGADAGSPPPGA